MTQLCSTICSIITLLLSLECAWAAQENASKSSDLKSHPLYEVLNQTREKRAFRRFFVGYQFSVMQMSVNTNAPSQVGPSEMIPGVGLEIELWPLKNWGLRLEWTKNILVFFPNADPSNSFYKSVDFLTPLFSYRYYFHALDQNSYIQFGLGFQYFHFGLVADDSIPWVKGNYGPVIAIERKLAITQRFGVLGAFKGILPLHNDVQQAQWISKKSSLGFQFDIEFYYTITNQEGLETLVGLSYAQRDFIYKTTGEFEAQFNRSTYQQTFRSFQLQFSAKL